MSALPTREAARTRATAAFAAALDRIIPADESVPLKGCTFLDFEDQAETIAGAGVPVVSEERSALEPNAQVDAPGRCPHCGSDRVYLRQEVTQPEVHSRHGPVVLHQQHARCRACNGSFSPSGAGLEWADGSAADPSGGEASGAPRRTLRSVW